MYVIKITESAERDLKDAAGYIAIELKNRVAAGRLLDDVIEAVSIWPARLDYNFTW
jgi:plasmid stabilization system protein ParE